MPIRDYDIVSHLIITNSFMPFGMKYAQLSWKHCNYLTSI